MFVNHFFEGVFVICNVLVSSSLKIMSPSTLQYMLQSAKELANRWRMIWGLAGVSEVSMG